MDLQGEVKDYRYDLPRQESVYDRPGYGYPQFSAPKAVSAALPAHKAHTTRLSAEVKDTGRDLERDPEPQYARSAAQFMHVDASGRDYYDLNAAMQGYRGAWLFGQQHVEVMVGGRAAQWEQFCPVPADVPDGVLLMGNVIYRQANGTWLRSRDRYSGHLVTQRLVGPGRYFVGRTEHTFTGRGLPAKGITVQGNLHIHLSEVAASHALVPIFQGR